MKFRQMINLRRITFQDILLAAAFFLGIVLRFANLGTAPLSDSEANLALQALQFSKGIPIESISPQPAYIVLTGTLFSFFGSSNFLARFWSAMAGSLLVLLPFIVWSCPDRRRFANLPTLVILAFGLAGASGLVASSRFAGSPMMALSFLILAAALFYTDRPIVAGFAGGLALLSGPDVVTGGLILIVTGLVVFLFNRRRTQPADSDSLDGEQETSPHSRNFFVKLLASTTLTVLIIGTAFFRFPAGLAALVDTLPAYLSGWITPSGIPISRMLVALVVYQPVAVLFGLVGIVRGLFLKSDPAESEFARLTVVWILISQLLTLVYPGRQIADLVWVIIPFWLIAAWEISHYIPQGKIQTISIIQALLLILLMGLFWYNLVSMNRFQDIEYDRLARYVVMVGILALGALITVLIQLGWSWEAARLGLAWGVIGGLVLYSISMLWGAAYLRQNQPEVLWAPTPAAGQAKLILSTLHDLSYWNTGRADSIDIISEISDPSMRWLLRNYSNARYTDRFNQTELASILITRQEQAAPALTASYRGQDFTWTISPNWSGAIPSDYIGWLTFRNAPTAQQNIILWARSDLFPGGTLTQSSNPPAGEPSTQP